MPGFMGKYLVVHLGDGSTEKIEPGDAFYRQYLGGYGLAAGVIARRQPAGLEPMDPRGHLAFCPGLLTGSGALFTGRYMVAGKSPLTGTWGDANSGGFLSVKIKQAGYDAVFFTGRAPHPTFVEICEDKVSLRDARKLWGMDAIESEGAIKQALGDPKAQVATIGPSGEKLSLISGVVTGGGRIAARSGLGALMGSKNLKAVSFQGSKAIPVARPDKVKAVNKKLLEAYRQKVRLADKIAFKFGEAIPLLLAKLRVSFPAQTATVRELWRTWGTAGAVVYSAVIGDMPIRNWTGVGYLDYTVQSAAKCSGEMVLERQRRRYACQSCPLGCGGMVEIRKGRYAGGEGHKPEYESIGAFGGLLLQDDLDAVIEMNEMCNRAGMDTISAGAAIAFAIECFEKGILCPEALGGLELGWGRTESIVKLLEMMIAREGFGDLLADGVRKAAERIGSGAELCAMHAGGQELPMHDSRFDHGFAIAYKWDPTPGRHTTSSFAVNDLYAPEKRFPLARRMIREGRDKVARKVKRYTAGSYYAQLIHCGGCCIFGAESSTYPVVEYYNAVTGWDLSPDDYLLAGRRILCLRRAFNAREGVRPEDTELPPRALGRPAMTRGPLQHVSVDQAGLEKVFLETVGWDPVTGAPTPETMREVGLEPLA
ncbi:MAG: aldehyde ferredoxin oxidoreductase family protein [bacterium]